MLLCKFFAASNEGGKVRATLRVVHEANPVCALGQIVGRPAVTLGEVLDGDDLALR